MPVSTSMISKVSQMIKIPLIVGGGIKTPEMAAEAVKAGADIIVIGTAFEKEPEMLKKFAEAIHSVS